MSDDTAAIAAALHGTGWCHCPGFLPPAQVAALRADLLARQGELAEAGVGRGEAQRLPEVRSDRILWLCGEGAAQREFLQRMELLRLELNRHLFLGLFDYEAHYACYAPQAFYRRHRDTFQGSQPPRRLLSSVLYLNEDWRADDGGELLLYGADGGQVLRAAPTAGSALFFLSAEFPHEVLPARRARYSIAGWFRGSA